MDSVQRPGRPCPRAHLPGLQLEAQAQLRVVDGGVPLQLDQGLLEVGQGLLGPAGAGATALGGQPCPAFSAQALGTPAGGRGGHSGPSEGLKGPVLRCGCISEAGWCPALNSGHLAPMPAARLHPRPSFKPQLCPGNFPPACQAPPSQQNPTASSLPPPAPGPQGGSS